MIDEKLLKDEDCKQICSEKLKIEELCEDMALIKDQLIIKGAISEEVSKLIERFFSIKTNTYISDVYKQKILTDLDEVIVQLYECIRKTKWI